MRITSISGDVVNDDLPVSARAKHAGVAQVRTRPRAARGGRDEGQVLLLRVGGVGGQLLLLLAGGEGGPLNSGVGFSCNNQPTGGGVAREAVPVTAINTTILIKPAIFSVQNTCINVIYTSSSSDFFFAKCKNFSEER